MHPTPAAFYARMTLIRQVEQTFFDLYSRGLMAGTVHTAIGQEAAAVGVIAHLDPTRDVVFSSHRAHGHFLAFTDDVEGLVAELLGRATGVAGGIGGTQHLHAPNFYSNGIQGGIVPNAAGAALAAKLAAADEPPAARPDAANPDAAPPLVAVFLGDGTLGEGVVYETLNLAALWSLPLLLVLEDNGYAQSTPSRLARAGTLAARPEAFGVKTFDCTTGRTHALSVDEVSAAAAAAAAYVRGARAAAFLALRTYRLAPHSKGDDHRAPEELAAAWAADPLARLAATLDEPTVAALDAAAASRITAAVAAALAAPHQSPAEFAAHASWSAQ